MTPDYDYGVQTSYKLHTFSHYSYYVTHMIKKLELPLLLNLYTEDILEIFLLQATKLEQSLPMILQFFELEIKILGPVCG